ncbi:MAG: hypothetical protein AAFO74_07475 [Pseudomonadota bacterium]
MLTLQIIAFVLLGLSALLLFGPQLVIYGPKMARQMSTTGQVQFVGGCWVSVLALSVMAPQIGAAMSSGSSAMSLVVIDIFTMQFGLV